MEKEHSDAVVRALHPWSEIVRHGENLVIYYALYRKIVMGEAPYAQQSDQGVRRAGRILRRIAYSAFLLELIAFWEVDKKTSEQSLSLSGAIFRTEKELYEYPDLLMFPLGDGSQGFDEVTVKLRRIIKCVLGGRRFKRLQNHRNKYVAHKLTKTSAEKELEMPIPIYEDLDRLFLYSLVALREVSKSILLTPNASKEAIELALHDATALLNSLSDV